MEISPIINKYVFLEEVLEKLKKSYKPFPLSLSKEVEALIKKGVSQWQRTKPQKTSQH